MKLKKKTLVKRDLEHVENLIGCSIPGSIMISLQKLFQEEFPKKRKKERKKEKRKKKKRNLFVKSAKQSFSENIFQEKLFSIYS